MSNSSSITDQRHNDYVGSDANIGRIPGANKATTGHHFVSVFPKGKPIITYLSSCDYMLRRLYAQRGHLINQRKNVVLRNIYLHLLVEIYLLMRVTEFLQEANRPTLHQTRTCRVTISPLMVNCTILCVYRSFANPALAEDPYHQTDRPPQPLKPAPGSNTVIDRDPWASKPSAADTLQGATSQDVHGGIGQPFGGQTSAELHHDGKQHRKRNLQGVDQYGNADEV